MNIMVHPFGSIFVLLHWDCKVGMSVELRYYLVTFLSVQPLDF